MEYLHLYRLCMEEEADDIVGTSGMTVSSFWSDGSQPCIYAHSTIASCFVENRVYRAMGEINPKMIAIEYSVPAFSFEKIEVNQLPEDWENGENGVARSFGVDVLKAARTLVTAFPSIILADEFTFIINPIHPLISEIRIKRIFKPMR